MLITIMIALLLLTCLFWLAFHITEAILAAMIWLCIKLPIALILWFLGLLLCITIILIPIGGKLFGTGFRVLV